MPRPCAVEVHAGGYKSRPQGLADATASRRGGSRLRLQKSSARSRGCHGLAPWRLTLAATKVVRKVSRMPRPRAVETTLAATKVVRKVSRMPRPCAVEVHAGSYKIRPQGLGGPGLARWRFTLAAVKFVRKVSRMPRPCAVEVHAGSYKIRPQGLADATALCRGGSRWRLQNSSARSRGCHGLVPWRFTLAATKFVRKVSRMPRPCAVEVHAGSYKIRPQGLADATALCRGGSRWQLQNSSARSRGY